MMTLVEKEKKLKSELQKIRRKIQTENANKIYKYVLEKYGTGDIDQLREILGDDSSMAVGATREDKINDNKVDIEWEGF